MASAMKKGILIGCGAVTLVGLVCLAGCVGCIAYMAQDVKGMAIRVEAPQGTEVAVGNPLTLTINVVNERQGQPLKVTTIDVAQEFLDGFTVVSTDPAYRACSSIPVDNTLSFTFDTSIPAGQSQAFTFVLKAERAGIYRGDVDVCEGVRFTTTLLQATVTE